MIYTAAHGSRSQKIQGDTDEDEEIVTWDIQQTGTPAASVMMYHRLTVASPVCALLSIFKKFFILYLESTENQYKHRLNLKPVI
jgi:hypothetical protein